MKLQIRSESDRNWPEDLHRRDPQLPEQQEQTQAVLKTLIEAGISTDPVVERVLDAIVNQRFYILTHEGSEDAVEQRMRRISRGENPVMPAGGIGIFMPSM